MDRSLATYERPLLNQGPYISDVERTHEDDYPLYHKSPPKRRTHMSEETESKIYQSVIRYFTQNEVLRYKEYQSGQRKVKDFIPECTEYLYHYFPEEMQNKNDFEAMMDRILNAIFRYDVLQDLIDDEEISDIKICGPYDIRVRVKGKAYSSDVQFIDEDDLCRFIEGLAIRNNVNLNKALSRFSDDHADEFILRFSISSAKTSAKGYPLLHIRKIGKKKLLLKDLKEIGMMNDDVMRYLIDRAKTSKGLFIAGAPGSGKTVGINALIEYIPKIREVLIIQETNELFTDQAGFMFKNSVDDFDGVDPVTLEDLTKMALVEGVNHFIIGEAKGAEMRYAMTLQNSGGYFWTTLHSNSAKNAMEKAADLIKYGSDYSYEDAKKMLSGIDTIIFFENFKVKEIVEVNGYDIDKKDFNYVYIYRRDAE